MHGANEGVQGGVHPAFIVTGTNVHLVDTTLTRVADVRASAAEYEQAVVALTQRAQRREGLRIAVVRRGRKKHHVRRTGAKRVNDFVAVTADRRMVSLVDDDHVPSAGLNRRRYFPPFDVVD